jgi:hypothetical protein
LIETKIEKKNPKNVKQMTIVQQAQFGESGAPFE